MKVYITDAQAGAKKQKWFGGFKTRKEAESRLSELLAQIHGGGTVPTTKMTVGQFLREWLEKHESNVRPTSFKGYREIVDLHLVPAMGAIPLRELTPLHVQGYFTSKLQGKKDANGKWVAKPLAQATVRKHRAILREALGHAVEWGLLARNVCTLARLSKKRQRKETLVWDEEQVQLFLGEAKRSSPYYPLYLMAVSTALREGELLGLRWPDVDLTTGTATIRQTLYRLSGQILFGEPKSEKSRRTVALLPILVEVLRTLKAEQDRLRREFGSAYHDLGEHGPLVFCQPDGKPLHAANIARRDMRRVIKKAGVPRIRFHDLRHTTATHLLEQGENPKAVSELLGHSSVAFTMDVYGHVLPGRQAQMMARLQERLFGIKTE